MTADASAAPASRPASALNFNFKPGKCLKADDVERILETNACFSDKYLSKIDQRSLFVGMKTVANQLNDKNEVEKCAPVE